MIELVSPRLKVEWHAHKCPNCKQVKREPNTVCGRSSGDHVYRCLNCLSGFWRRFGDAFMDAYLDEDEFTRLKAIAPDRVSEDLDERDKARLKKEMVEAAVEQSSKVQLEVDPQAEAKAQKEAHDQLIDEADRLTQDEVIAEMEKIKKEKSL